MENPTDEQIEELLSQVEGAGSEEPQGDTPEDTENLQAKLDESLRELAGAKSRIEVLEEQNKRLFDSMSKMVKSTPVSTEAPKPPQTEAERRAEMVEKYDYRKLDLI